MRTIWHVHTRTQCRLLECSGIEYELLERFTPFYHSICTSKTRCTRLCSMLCKTAMTIVALNRICAKLNISRECLNEYSKLELIKLNYCNDKCKTDGFALKELCLVRDG